MSLPTQSLALLIAGLVFVIFVIAKLIAPENGRGPHGRAARQRIADAKRRASDHGLDAATRATALREACVIALEELKRPNLAASYAKRAERLDPGDPEALGLLAQALRRAERFGALERLLWRRVADAAPADPSAVRAFGELLSLYEGPLKRPEVARALRRLTAAA